MDTTFLELLEIPIAICEPESYLVEFGNSRFWEGVKRRPVKVPIMALLKGFQETDFLKADLTGDSYKFMANNFNGDQVNFQARETRIPKRCILFQGGSGTKINLSELGQDEVSQALFAAGEESFFLANLEAQQALLLARTLGLKQLEADAFRWMEESISLMSSHIFRGFLMSFQVHSVKLDFRLFASLLEQEVKLTLQDSGRNFSLAIASDVPRLLKGPFPFIHMTIIQFYKALIQKSESTTNLDLKIEVVSRSEGELQLEFVVLVPEDPIKVDVLERARDLFQAMFFKFTHEARSYDILWTAYLVRNSGGLFFYEDPRVLRLQWSLKEVVESGKYLESSQFDPDSKDDSEVFETKQSSSDFSDEDNQELDDALNSTEDLLASLIEEHSAEIDDIDEDDLLSADSFAQEKLEQKLAQMKNSKVVFVEESKEQDSTTQVQELERESLVNSVFDDLGSMAASNNQASQVLDEVMEDISNQRKILVAEDNRVNQTIFEQILKREGYLYKVCFNGQEALDELENDNYCMILMDLQMPVMNGFEAAQKIREKEKTTGEHLPIIAVSANLLEEDYEVVKQAGMDDFVVKPINRLELLKKIKEYLPK